MCNNIDCGTAAELSVFIYMYELHSSSELVAFTTFWRGSAPALYLTLGPLYASTYWLSVASLHCSQMCRYIHMHWVENGGIAPQRTDISLR